VFTHHRSPFDFSPLDGGRLVGVAQPDRPAGAPRTRAVPRRARP
jgi:hypothetical protein